jgi:hypothetical protein
MVRREFNILALVKGEERYVYVFDDESRAEVLSVLSDQAADPRLDLSWFDAAVLSEKLRQQLLKETLASGARSRV